MSSTAVGEAARSPSPLRVALITGAPLAGRCGIHDYVGQLASALATADGLDAEVVSHEDWSPRGVRRLLGRVRALRPDILHIQYPMIVGWRSLGPHSLGFLMSTPQVVTLHEFSSFDRLRRASMGAFAVSAKRIVLTTDFERARFLGMFPRAEAKTAVIPIGSNVPFLPPRPGGEVTVIHFGQIKPGRGLEDFLRVARIAARTGAVWRFKVVGAPVTWAADFVAGMQAQTEGGNVEWSVNLGDADAADALRSADVAYLPYPDGVSERRGSLIAALGNGLPVVTTRGPFQTSELEKVVSFAADPHQAFAAIAEIVGNPAKGEAMRSAAFEYVKKFGWPQIADAYRSIYRRLAHP